MGAEWIILRLFYLRKVETLARSLNFISSGFFFRCKFSFFSLF